MTLRRPGMPGAAEASFDELSRLVLADQSTDSVMAKVAELARSVVPGAVEVSVSLLDAQSASGPTTAATTGGLALALDEVQYTSNEGGPCVAAAQGGETIVIEDTAVDRRWPDFAATAVRLGIHSSLSTPLPIQQTRTGSLNIYGTEAQSFDEESRALATTFASYAAVALSNIRQLDETRRLAANLEAAMASRAVIDQAKGVLMAQRRISADRAFDLLVAASQRTNRKVRDVAARIVASVDPGSGPSATPGPPAGV